MTRGIVIVKDKERQEVLYLPSDAYVGGAMDLALEYCEANHGKNTSVQELAFALMKVIPDMQIYSMSSNPGLDNVYTIELINGACPRSFVYQKIPVGCSYDNPMPTELSERRDYRTDSEERKRAAEEYWRHQQKLKDSILPCPHCGRKGWHNFSPRGEKVQCFIDSCPGHAAGKWCKTTEEAIDAWNQYVSSVDKF